ncbi:MAG: hypothetical protein C4522_13230 [Desulfobacteraceae bacterium]|nr:MAG: hypothetical protein C4522_13230 [Desulfobacteraceae bacterium]
MEFKDFFPFIVLAVYILSLFGKKRKAEKDAPVQKKSSLKSIIQTIAERLKEHAETLKRDQERQRRQTPDERSQPEMTVGMTAGNEKKRSAVFPATDRKTGTAEEVLPDHPVPENDPKTVLTDSTGLTSVSLQELRKAVVWSEILGSPVALRENHRKFPWDA